MSTKPKPIPDGYSAVTPYLIIKGAARAIDFYQRIFGARERMRIPGPGDAVMHAEIEIGGSVIMLADEFPHMGAVSPETLGGTPVFVHLYVPDADAMFANAVGAGAKAEQPMENKFYGDRSGTLLDPFGHRWTLATHVEDVTPEEIGRRMAAMMKGG
ncbi:MAG: VOC family protein [Limisphaerales bacterium]